MTPPAANNQQDAEIEGKSAVLVMADDIGVFLAIARSLGRIGVVVDIATSISGQPGFASRYIRDVHHLPSYLHDTESWLEQVRQLCRTNSYRLIIPTSDSALATLNRHIGHFPSGQLALPNAEALDIFSDKLKTRDLAAGLGIAMADGMLLDHGSDSAAIIAQLGLPMIAKPRQSFQWGDRDDKQWAQVISSPEQLAQVIADNPPDTMIAESFFQGDGVGISVLAQNGVIQLAWQHRRLEAVSATGKSSSRKGEPVDSHLYQDVERLAEAISLDGIAMFEFRHNSATGDHILIEVNPRFWGSLPLAVAAGADFPAAYWRQTMGQPAVPATMDRHAIKQDLIGELARIGQELTDQPGWHDRFRAIRDLSGLALCLLWPRSLDSWAKDDPAPFVQERKTIFGRLYHKLFARD